MSDKPKKPWTKPVLRRVEPSDALLKLVADQPQITAMPPAKFLK